MILGRLLSKLDHIFIDIEESKDLFTYTQDDPMGLLLVHEERMNIQRRQSIEEAFKSIVEESGKKDEEAIWSHLNQLYRDICRLRSNS